MDLTNVPPGICSIVGFCVGLLGKRLSKKKKNIVNFFHSFHHQEGWQYWQTDEKVRAEFFSRRFSGMHHTIWGGNNKELEDDIVVDVNPRNYEP